MVAEENQSDVSTAGDFYICGTPNCGKKAELACPSCIKLGISPTRFCTQECFKSSWNEHKELHKKIKKTKEENKYLEDPTSMPAEFQGFTFTGPLRPCQKTPTRFVPPDIGRPDYADHREVQISFSTS